MTLGFGPVSFFKNGYKEGWDMGKNEIFFYFLSAAFILDWKYKFVLG